MTDPTPETTPTRDEAVEAVAAAFKRMHSDTCYPSASDGEAKWAAEEIIKAYKAAVDRVNRATDAEIGGIHRSLASAPAPASGGVDAVAEAKIKRLEKERDRERQFFLAADERLRHAVAVNDRLHQVREALEPFATSCDNHFHDASILDNFEDDASVLMLVRDGKLSPTGVSVGDLRRAKQVYAASLSPAATPVSEAEPVAFPADGELLNMEDGERANAFWRWSKAAGLPLHMAESGLNRFQADDRTEWAWQAWCAALAEPASSPAGGDVVEQIARMIAPEAFKAFDDDYRPGQAGPSSAQMRAIGPMNKARETARAILALSQSTSAGRVGG